MLCADGDTVVNPLVAVAQPATKEAAVPAAIKTTTNPLMQAPAVAQPHQRHPKAMMFNPLVAQGTPVQPPVATSEPAVSPVSPTPDSAPPVLAAATPEADDVITPLSAHHVLPPSTPVDVVEASLEAEAAEATPVPEFDIPPPVEAVPEVRAVLEDSLPVLASIQTARNVEAAQRDRTRVSRFAGGNNGPVSIALARGESPKFGPYPGYARISPSAKKSFTDLARTSRSGSSPSGSRRTSPAASPYTSPAPSRQASPTRSRPASRRSSPASSRAGSPVQGSKTGPQGKSGDALTAGKPPKQPAKVYGSTAYQVNPIAVPLGVEVSSSSGSSQPGRLPRAAEQPVVSSQETQQQSAQPPGAAAQAGSSNPGTQPAQQAQQQLAEQASSQGQGPLRGPFGPSGPSQMPGGMPFFLPEVFLPARARAAALRQQQEAQRAIMQQQQPLGIVSSIERSVKEQTASAAAAAAPAEAAAAMSSSSLPASSSQLPSPIKVRAPANPKAKIMEEVRAAELARAIAPQPRIPATAVVTGPPSTLTFHGAGGEGSSEQMLQDRPLSAAHFKALERQFSGEKTVQDALAVEASLSFGQLPPPSTAVGRQPAPETIAEAEALEGPAPGAQQPAMQTPFAKHRKFTPSMTADDMAAMAMGAIDRIRGRATQDDEEETASVASEPAPGPRGAVRSKSMPKQGSSEDLSSLALAAIARLRNLADQAKEPSPRSSSAPRPSRPAEFDHPSPARRLQLPEGPAAFKPSPQRSTARSASMQSRPSEPSRAAELVPVSPAKFQDIQTPFKSRQRGSATLAEAPATPLLPVPAAAQHTTPPSRAASPLAPTAVGIVSAAEVASQQPQQQVSPSLSTVVAQPAVPAEPSSRLEQQQSESAEHAEPARAADSFTTQIPQTPGGSPEGSPVAQASSQDSRPEEATTSEGTAPPSPSDRSFTSSRGDEKDEEPYEFDEAAASARAKEKGKAVLTTADFRPVSHRSDFGKAALAWHVSAMSQGDGVTGIVSSCLHGSVPQEDSFVHVGNGTWQLHKPLPVQTPFVLVGDALSVSSGQAERP